MIIDKISLSNFRNYDRLDIKFEKNMNIIIGNNAQGKTNILESIYVLALTKSYKQGIEENFIKFNENFTKIKGIIKTDKLKKDLEIFISLKGKKIKVNNNEIKKLSDYISNLNIIMFTPDDLEIIKGSPSFRRNLLNIQISQISKRYLQAYNEYNKILKIRNEYLKILYINNLADFSYLDILTEKLIDKAIIVYQERQKYIDQINLNIPFIYENIIGLKNIRLIYETNVDFKTFEAEEIKKKLLEKYQQNKQRELVQGITLYGPHRDDFSFFIGDKNLKLFGSQGQQKIAVLSYKLAEISIFEQKLKTKPVLLLDDIFNEIDIKKRNKILAYINKDIQSIITTTDLKNINKKMLENAVIFEIKNNKVERK